jgi:hypothetical protein
MSIAAGGGGYNHVSPHINRRMYKKILYKLNTSLCQFTARASKTKKAIEYIKHFSILSRLTRGIQEDGVHHMNIILTNNSLLETQMWRHRLNTKTKELKLKICTLSSKKNSTFNSLDQITSMFVNAKSANDLPDILVMCTHGARTNDIIKLITNLELGNLDFTRIGIHEITATVMFDEADKNVGLIADFVKELNKEIFSKTNNTVIRDIHFITATPGKKFWKKLDDAGIKELENIHHYLRDNEVLDYDHDLLYKDYRSINEHHISSIIDDMTDDPIDYASKVLDKILKDRKNKKRNGPLTIFSPAQIKIVTHYKMAELFQKNNFTVLILNGEKKGFLNPDDSYESIEEFNSKTGITGELYNTLVKWRELNEDKDLAITGYLSVQRGVTFCTKGFNFTDMIVSAYHLRDIDSLIQILGRANGEKEYVQIMNIWAPKTVIDEANEMILILNQLHTRDPEIYIESDFRKKTSKELREPALSIPDILIVSSDDWDTIIKKKGRVYDVELILSYIKKQNKTLADELSKMNKKQITMPTIPDEKTTSKKSNSYKKHILDLVSAAEKGNTFSVDITKDESNKDVYQIFLDSKEKRLVISRYYGTRLPE